MINLQPTSKLENLHEEKNVNNTLSEYLHHKIVISLKSLFTKQNLVKHYNYRKDVY